MTRIFPRSVRSTVRHPHTFAPPELLEIRWMVGGLVSIRNPKGGMLKDVHPPPMGRGEP